MVQITEVDREAELVQEAREMLLGLRVLIGGKRNGFDSGELCTLQWSTNPDSQVAIRGSLSIKILPRVKGIRRSCVDRLRFRLKPDGLGSRPEVTLRSGQATISRVLVGAYGFEEIEAPRPSSS